MMFEHVLMRQLNFNNLGPARLTGKVKRLAKNLVNALYPVALPNTNSKKSVHRLISRYSFIISLYTLHVIFFF